MLYYKLDEDKNVISCSREEMGDWFDENNWLVKQEIVNEKFVSTVFLHICHNYLEEEKPVVFETMIKDGLKGEWLNYQERYCTWKEAEEGHKRAVQWVLDGCKGIEEN